MQGGRDMLHGSRAEMRRYLGRYQAVSGDEKVDAPHHRRALPPGTHSVLALLVQKVRNLLL